MNETLLEAQERNEKASSLRKNGFVPGVIYGKGLKESKSVKFDAKKMDNYLKSLSGRKVQVKLNGSTQTGFIREIQREPVSGKMTHIDIQIAGLNDNVKMKLPVVFEGRTKLEAHGLLLDVHASEVTVFGKEKDIPESIMVDVSEGKVGDVIDVASLTVGNGVKLLDEAHEVLAIITEPKRVQEDKEEAAADEAAAPEQ